MCNKERLYTICFIFAIVSVITAMVIKYYWADWFKLKDYSITWFHYVESAIRFLITLTVYTLIVGCVTKYPPKTLLLKMIPYTPLTLVFNYLPTNVFATITALIVFVTCFSMIPKFSTVINFALNVIFIAVIQLSLIWLRLDIKQFAPVFPRGLNVIIINIDQIIILLLLYYVNRKEVIKKWLYFSVRQIKKLF